MSGVLIMNKPFLGGWLSTEGNIGHEIIDFLLTDNEEYYVYNNPWGVCPDNIWVEGTSLPRKKSEKFVAKYLVLTSAMHEESFQISYVIELAEKLHRCHTSNNRDRMQESQTEVKQIIENRKIKYNGKFLYDIYSEDDSMFVTFKASKIYKAQEIIEVNGLRYNFQRNKGYLYNDKKIGFPDDYEKINNLIKSSIQNNTLVEYLPRSIKSLNVQEITGNNFLNLIGMKDREQVYTNMLYSILKEEGLLIDFCIRFVGNTEICSEGAFSVKKESKVVDGRMDICAENSFRRVIIENKVFSGLNGIDKVNNRAQLSVYYEWGKEMKSEPLCFIVAPDFRMEEISKEIRKYDPEMENKYTKVPFSEIAAFINDELNDNKITPTYSCYGLVPYIAQCFSDMSSSSQEIYARMFLDATR